jgi:hypothetical protein
MLKHIREAIKQSGVDPREITVEHRNPGHVTLVIRGRTVVASSSPKNETIAARNIAKDIRRCLTDV